MAGLSPARANSSTPHALGYRMPAEWETHSATWLAWPHERTDWPGKFAPIPWIYADIARHLSRFERVHILVRDRDEQEKARDMLAKSGANLAAVDFFIVPTNRGWTRDFAPIFVAKNGAAAGDGTGTSSDDVALTNWRFNAWAKYDDWKKDDAATGRLIPKLATVRPKARALSKKIQVWEPMHKDCRVVLEGGSIDVNGLGTLLTTEECLLSKTQERNPGFARADYESVFREYFGATNVLWLGNGIVGDDTHGHVDDLARFVNPNTVIAVAEENRSDPNFEPLQENLARLRKMKDQAGMPLRVETLPMPEPVYFAGQRLPASYANFYIANRLVLVPTFSDFNDRIAIAKLAALFPDRAVVGIPCRDLVLGLGTLHCMTQQQPA